MWCASCRWVSSQVVFPNCRAGLEKAGPRLVGGRLDVYPAYLHLGFARSLVHSLKYRGAVGAAAFLAEEMALLVGEARCLVPVPRRPLRKLRYGVDPALELALAVGKLTGIPVIKALGAGWIGPAHAGKNLSGRPIPEFRLLRPVVSGVLIDDVVTTGATLLGALNALGEGVLKAVTATGTPGSSPRGH